MRTHTDDLIAAVHASNEVVVSADNDTHEAALHDARSFHSLQRAVTVLERVIAERADAIEEQRAEINVVLTQLRVVHRACFIGATSYLN